MVYISPDNETFLKAIDKVPYRNKGIFPHELMVFWNTFQKHKCTYLVESGILSGYSTQILAELGINMTSFDKDVLPNFHYPNLMMLKGNSLTHVPFELGRRNNETVGVLIDGPKQELALDLKDSCLLLPNVAFVAVHDLRPELREGSDYNSYDMYDIPQNKEIYDLANRNVGEYKEKYPKGTGLTFFVKK